MAPLFDDVVIDGRGANDKGLIGSLVVADVCLTPVWPGQFDLSSLANMQSFALQALEEAVLKRLDELGKL